MVCESYLIMRLETILESKIENIPESTQLRRELRDKDRLLNAILFRLRQIPQLNQHLNLENLLSTIDELISQLDEIQNTTREGNQGFYSRKCFILRLNFETNNCMSSL